MLLEYILKKFEINQTKIKGGCQSGRKLVTHNSKSDLPVVYLSRRQIQVRNCCVGRLKCIILQKILSLLLFLSMLINGVHNLIRLNV